MRILYLIAGLFFVALAVVGAFLPVMPSTIFLILAAGCFARSSPRLEAWLVNHAHLGPPIRRWRERGAIARPAKLMAVGGMALGFGVFYFTARPGPALLALVAAILLACAAFVVSRPEQ